MLFPQKPLAEMPLGEWTFEQAYSIEKRKKIKIKNLENSTIAFKENYAFEISDVKDEIKHQGKWRIKNFDFSVDIKDSTGQKSSSDSKKIIAIFSDQDLYILGEASFSKKTLKIDDVDGKNHKVYILKKNE